MSKDPRLKRAGVSGFNKPKRTPVLNPAWRGRLDRTNDQFLWEPASKADLNDYRVVNGIPH